VTSSLPDLPPARVSLQQAMDIARGHFNGQCVGGLVAWFVCAAIENTKDQRHQLVCDVTCFLAGRRRFQVAISSVTGEIVGQVEVAPDFDWRKNSVNP
jgi:hypothetical protein